MHDIKNIIMRIKDQDDVASMNKLSCMVEKLMSESSDPDKYKDELYILENGYHFNEEMYNKAIEGMDAKWSPDMVESVMSSHNIKFSPELGITKFDKAYVMNMMYKKFYPLISDSSTASKFSEKYLKCEYPVPGGRAFAEWNLKCKLKKEIK